MAVDQDAAIGASLMPAHRAPEIAFRPACDALKPQVETFYLCRFDSAEVAGVERVDIGQIRFMLSGEGMLTFHDGRQARACPVMVNPPGTAAFAWRVCGPFDCFGVSLRPIGWKALIGLPAHAVADTVVDGAALFGAGASDLLERLRRMRTLDEMAAATERFLLARRRPVPPAHVALARAVREWGASDALGVQALFDMVDMTPRHVTRLCNEYFGGPPKLLERKFRAIGAAMRIYQGASNRDVVARFADQSHMNREIKRFTGHTPSSLRAGIDPILAVTLEKETFHVLPEVFPETVDEA